MKRLITLALVAILSSGCASMFVSTASRVADKVYLGMPVKDFQQLAGSAAKLEALSPDATVYRINIYDNGNVVGGKYFHFDSEGRLFKMDSSDFRDNPWMRERRHDHSSEEK
jgi:hypothetical protein